MIGQYLPQTNESATVPKTKKISELTRPKFLGYFLKLFFKKKIEPRPALAREVALLSP